MTFKETFLKCMQIQYPHALNWEKDKDQHRALIKCFAMAWVESARAAADAIGIDDALKNLSVASAMDAHCRATIGKKISLLWGEALDETAAIIADPFAPIDESWRWKPHPSVSLARG